MGGQWQVHDMHAALHMWKKLHQKIAVVNPEIFRFMHRDTVLGEVTWQVCKVHLACSNYKTSGRAGQYWKFHATIIMEKYCDIAKYLI